MNENQLISAQPQLLIVTGYSGAGKSTVLRALEDIGFFCVDNLPIPLLNSFFRLISQSTMMGQKVALGIDVRSGKTMHEFIEILKHYSLHTYLIKIFFLTASSQVLCKRFQETRRKHPLADKKNLEEAIAHEQEVLKPLMERSDLVLDTDQLTIHQLRKFVRSSFSESSKPQLLVNLISFGFKYGIPSESNFIYDVRSLPNPYFVHDLRAFDGTSPKIREFLFTNPEVLDYWEKLKEFIHYSIKKSYEEGRFFTNIAIGCTGGVIGQLHLFMNLQQFPWKMYIFL